ncbi:hypothetical protein [Ligilactobacillus murinus]|uniref:hypothetical protein n=1 Tax=Ligilactobacillus murinus TaxID=1622 RepID=UPI001298583D|nr:hypothetical protein [Ligilactobacillus murinus]
MRDEKILFLEHLRSVYDHCHDHLLEQGRKRDQGITRPYVFTEKDARELSNLINTKYSFARKVNNANIPRKIFQDL